MSDFTGPTPSVGAVTPPETDNADPTTGDLFTAAVTQAIGGMGVQIYQTGQRNAAEAAKLREEE